MKDALTVLPREKGVLRVFSLDMSPQEAKFLRDTPNAATQALGLDTARETLIDVFAVTDLEDLGLAGYLIEGCGVSRAALAEYPALSELEGWVMTVPSQAIPQRPATLAPPTKLKLIAALSEPGTDWSGKTMTLPDISRNTATPRANRARARSIGATIFAIVMGVVVLVLWAIFT